MVADEAALGALAILATLDAAGVTEAGASGELGVGVAGVQEARTNRYGAMTAARRALDMGAMLDEPRPRRDDGGGRGW